MNPWLVLVFSLTGYLVGSISFSRIVLGWVKPGEKVQKIVYSVTPGGPEVESDAVSATAVRIQAGPKYGCMTAIFDILKVFLPGLLIRLYFPDDVYSLVYAFGGVVGHIWPLYYRFKGGRGQSPSLGAFMLVDWVGTVFSILLGMLGGRFLVSNIWVAQNLYNLIFIGWVWLRTNDLFLTLYVVTMVLFLQLVSWRETLQTYQLWKQGALPSTMDAVRLMDMGGGLGRIARWLGISRLENPAQTEDDQK